jgi:hypothetical protein
LSAARKAGASYYISGYVSTIGSQVAAVEQLVSTKSGVMVWRTSATYAAPIDAGATGATLHDIIVQFATHGQGAFNSGIGSAPSAPPSAAPRAKPVALATPLPIPATYDPTPAPAVVVTGAHVLVGGFTGTTEPGTKAYLSADIVQLLPRYNMSGVRLTGGPAEDSAGYAGYGVLVCAEGGEDFFLTGSVDSSRDDPGAGFSFTVVVLLKAYDCHNRTARPTEFQQTTDSVSVSTAVDNALASELQDVGRLKHIGQ